MLEKSMLLVKPDGVEKKLVDEIRKIILAYDLVITTEITKRLSKKIVAELYSHVSNVSSRDYFPELIEFMSSSDVHIFIVEGCEAIRKVREIIGKREPPSGIRARWAENIIKNVAHGPHTTAEAEIEINLILGGQKMEDKVFKKVFLLGGMSESGKSSLGRYLDSKGIPRLKIVSFLKEVMKKDGGTGDFVAWNDKNFAERQEWLNQEFVKEFMAQMSVQKTEYCVLESLYGPELAVYMKNAIGADKVVIVYVNMDLDIRLQRQMIRQNLNSIAEAEELLLPRDEKKKEWGVPRIEAVADVVIDNSGSLEELELKADAMIKQYCPGYLPR